MRVTVRSQVQRGGRAAKAYRRMGGKYNRKTTNYKRKQYNKNKKNKMMARRAPFVETKSKTHEDLVVQFPGFNDRSSYQTYNTELVHLNPDTFLMWHRGMEENEVLGNSCYAKFLKMKIGVRFPQSAFVTGVYSKAIPQTPQNYELVWGWIPNELGYTGNTTPKADAATITDIHQHINFRVKDYFDQQKDKMRFIPKAASTIRIVGRRKIRPDMRYLSTAPPNTEAATIGSPVVSGTIPDKYVSISWNMGKKLHLQPSAALHATSEGLYPNFGTWLPFAVFVNWDYANLPGGGDGSTAAYCPAIQYNDCIWYSDS